MKFDELDERMRAFETAHDHCVLPGIHIVVRLDGRGFTRLTKELHSFEAPYDERFRDLMVATTVHLFDCGFRVVYGYTQSDEISLLLHRDADEFSRKTRKLESILAGEASAAFSLKLGAHAVFDARVCQLPTRDLVTDYFRWRNEDAHRNALNAHAFWTLRKEGAAPEEAAGRLRRLSVAEKNELLFQRGVNFNDLPDWQKRGIGVFWEEFEKPAVNPLTQEHVFARRRRVHVEFSLPMKDAYSTFVETLVRREAG